MEEQFGNNQADGFRGEGHWITSLLLSKMMPWDPWNYPCGFLTWNCNIDDLMAIKWKTAFHRSGLSKTLNLSIWYSVLKVLLWLLLVLPLCGSVKVFKQSFQVFKCWTIFSTAFPTIFHDIIKLLGTFFRPWHTITAPNSIYNFRVGHAYKRAK